MTEPQEKPVLGQQQMHVTLTDGTELDVWVGSADMARWDRECIRRKWPTMQDVPALWMQYVTWAALTRQGLIAACPYDDFEQRADVRPVLPDTDEGDQVGPTNRALGPG